MNELLSLPNVGKVLGKLLVEVDICTPQQLREAGAREAFARIKAKDPSACIRMLYGLQGAVEGIRDNLIAPATMQELKKFYKSL